MPRICLSVVMRKVSGCVDAGHCLAKPAVTPVLNEYRAVFGGLFKRMYGLSPAQLARVFDGVAPKDLQLV